MEGRRGDDDEDTWFRGNHVLNKLRPIEEEIFKPSVQLFLNKKNGVVVVDDELIGSRAQDVEMKILSYRKADKEGPVADCLVDSFASIVYGFRLRTTGETEMENVEKLLARLQGTLTTTNNGLRLTCGAQPGVVAFDERRPLLLALRSCSSRELDSSSDFFAKRWARETEFREALLSLVDTLFETE